MFLHKRPVVSHIGLVSYIWLVSHIGIVSHIMLVSQIWVPAVFSSLLECPLGMLPCFAATHQKNGIASFIDKSSVFSNIVKVSHI